VRKHTDCPWVLLYIERWLKAPVQLEDGTLEPRERGTPQGSVISPLLSNLFLHYTFDRWMARNYPDIPFERFADDAVCHCVNEAQAKSLKEALEKRFAECELQLHPEKTKIVYCKDDDRRGNSKNESFDFLGYSFRARRSKNRFGKFFVNFSPGVSNAATKAIREEIRRWQLRCRIQPSYSRLDYLLRSLLQISTLSYISLSGPMFGELGDGEIQTFETASTKGRALGQQDSFKRPTVICSLAIAASSGDWTIRAG
jgi:RNA-directed DNA polymerase